MCAKTLNIAHRGARSLAPENTLAAARKALEIGADLWELDVAMTSDGVPFIVHDDTLARTSNVKQVFPERQPFTNHLFSWDDVQKLDFGSWFVATDPFKQIAAGKVTQAEQTSYRGEKAPTLREALAFTKDHNWRINVEIKDLSGTPGDATVVEKVVALIDELGMADRVLISSFNHTYLERVKKANPKIATAALVEQADPDPIALLKRLDAQAYNPRSRPDCARRDRQAPRRRFRRLHLDGQRRVDHEAIGRRARQRHFHRLPATAQTACGRLPLIRRSRSRF